MAEVPKIMAAMPMHQHRGVTRVAEAAGTEQIAGQLAGDLLSIARDGDAIVVWMMDQSVSMQRDRQAMASQLLQTLQSIEADDSSKMMHYVVAFGDGVRLIRDSTIKGYAAANSIASLPVDPSGVENTFQAVEWCLDNLFSSFRWLKGGEKQKLLVIWTDESGDDYPRLEQTIQRCLMANVRVDIIGPSAVLGAQTGYSAYQHPDDGKVYYLPVHRGPDSSFPQKLSLGYWHRGVPFNYDESFQGPWQGRSQNYGGSNLESLLSGFSPYALTRLARQTGGRYTIYDRPGDRSPFRVEKLADYLPDYRSIQEILFDLQNQPLRKLVLAAAEVTWNSPYTRYSEPPFHLLTQTGWITPVELRNRVRRNLPNVISRAQKSAAAVEEAIRIYAMADDMPAYQPQMPDRSPSLPPREPRGDQRRRHVRHPETIADSATASTEAENDATGMDSETNGGSEEQEASTEFANISESLMEQLYRQESSKRWRAWCDLNLGRLLAVSVRLRESAHVLTALHNNPDILHPNTNAITFSASDLPTGDPESIRRAELAVRLLKRCVAEHPDTPWAVMASRELQHGFGLSMQQRSVPPPPPAPPAPPGRPLPPRPQLPRL